MDPSILIGWGALAVTVGAVLFRIGMRIGVQLGSTQRSKHNEEQRQEKESTFYFRGLNFLLSDEPDKAIEEFIKVVRINSDTVEIHLSLGNLFRTRGEVGRAIRIHQNIIARPDLSEQNHTAALFALAEDYRQGGFVDRSVEAHRRVLSVDPNHQKALAGLMALHESEGRWDLALDVLKKLQQVSGQLDPRREAHLLLHQGSELAQNTHLEARINLFKSAIKVYPGCVEAYRLLGEAQLVSNKTRAAIKSFSTLKKTRPSHFFLLVDPLYKAYSQLGDEKGFDRCMDQAVCAPSASTPLILRWSQILEERNQLQKATEVLRQGISRYPGSATLARRLVLLLEQQNQYQEAITIAEKCLDHRTDQQPEFQCAHCGFKAQDIDWKCPQCHYWDTMEPL